MRSVIKRRVLTKAPVWLVIVAALAAAVLVVVDMVAADVVSSTAAGTTAAGTPATGCVLLAALTRLVLFGATAVVLAWRARAGDSEHAVWQWLTRAAWVATAASVINGGLDVARTCGVDVPVGAGAAVLGVGTLAACPLIYQGLIHWNRYGTVTSQPGDWLNGVGAVFTLTALGGLLLPWLDSPLAAWPTWQTQLWLLRVAAEIMLLGTAATVLIIGALLSDVRAWGLTVAIGFVTALDVTSAGDAAAAAGDGPLSDAGWAAVACALVGSAVLRAAPPLPRPVTTAAPTAGSFVVLIASIAVLVATGMIHHAGSSTTSMVRAAAAWAGLGALGVTIRGLQLIRLLAHLVTSRHEALTDDLTGLANRRALDRMLSEHLAVGAPVTLMIIDLDGFKEVNDRFGHAVGDELLRRAGALLRQVSPPQAVPARLGGDEFAIVLSADFPHTSPHTHAASDASPDEALALFAALARATAAPVLIEGRRLLARASVGIAVAAPGDTPEQLLRRADAAMYRAKTAGGAGVAVHDESAALAEEQRAQLVEELKALLNSPDAADDLDAGHLVVHYQPQVSAAGDVVGAEALIRWDNPRLGLLSPDRFLDLVEEYHLMQALTTQVLWQAARQAVQWQQQGHRLRMSVNLSAACLTHPDLPSLVDDVVQVTGLDVAQLVLEVTETSLMSDPQESIARLQELAARGIDISIDDYGSGYSSLAYLNDLPATELKLDRSLTQQVTTNARTADIVAGTIALAHRLGLRVIAEGVEDTTMLTALHALGCDETQGYLHARPLIASAFEDWLSTTTAPVPASVSAPVSAPVSASTSTPVSVPMSVAAG